jgi:hypothetical protein
MVMNNLHVFGIRHHGPGCARSVVNALEQLRPDIILIEGPPDAEPVLALLADSAMQPPIALLLYDKADLSRTAYYPFAMFSPEYQAIHYALHHSLPVRLIDLPQRYGLARNTGQEEATHHDPLSELAQSAGYDDAERWWDAMVEQRQDSLNLFEAIQEAMTALREEFASEDDAHTLLREAHMRQEIWRAKQEKFERIAVICGAWHVPALILDFSPEDADALCGLDAVNIGVTWIPWTYNRLSRYSGYGAGVQSPGWYHYLWETPDDTGLSIGWLAKVAQHLREKGLDASPAQVIDAVRLVETLATLRGRSRPDLTDLNEAVLSVMCHGNEAPMQLIQRDLIIGNVMGRVSDASPMVPLQQDFENEVQRLGLTMTEKETDLVLDLREDVQREISRFLYRLILLDIPWGSVMGTDVAFESWILAWEPGLIIQLIDRSVWGNTVLEAATNFAAHGAQTAVSLPTLTELVQKVLFAGLLQAVPIVSQCLENTAATTSDILQLMIALPPLAYIQAYGDIRQTDLSAVRRVTDSLTARIIIGLPAECVALDDAAADKMFEAIIACDYTIRLLDNAMLLADWHVLLERMFDQNGIHALIRGRCCRIVIDANHISRVEGVHQMRLALASGTAPLDSAAWLQGFLEHSGTILVHDDDLLNIVDEWVMILTVDEFESMLPLIRRTFATFEKPEIRSIGRRISGKPIKTKSTSVTIDTERASEVNVTLSQLLGEKEPDDAA